MLLILFQFGRGAFTSTTCARAIRCLTSGAAQAYDAEYQARLEVLENPLETVVVFSPYKVQADLLYAGDFTGDPDDLTNQRVAEYFDKVSVCVKWE